MKKTGGFFQTLVGLILLVTFTLGLAVLFRAISGGQPAQSSSQTEAVPSLSSVTPIGYPAPPTLPPPSVTPIGYPAPPTLRPTLTGPEMTAVIATESAFATAHAPVVPTLPGVVLGPQTIRDASGQIQLTLLPGWQAIVFGDTIITNYDTRTVVDNHAFPTGGLKIQIGIGKLLAGQSFDQWVSDWIAREISEDVAGPGASASTPQPYTLGLYSGVTFTVTGAFSAAKEIALLSGERVVIIGLTPADSSAMLEALSMLSTLEVLPEQP